LGGKKLSASITIPVQDVPDFTGKTILAAEDVKENFNYVET